MKNSTFIRLTIVTISILFCLVLYCRYSNERMTYNKGFPVVWTGTGLMISFDCGQTIQQYDLPSKKDNKLSVFPIWNFSSSGIIYWSEIDHAIGFIDANKKLKWRSVSILPKDSRVYDVQVSGENIFATYIYQNENNVTRSGVLLINKSGNNELIFNYISNVRAKYYSDNYAFIIKQNCYIISYKKIIVIPGLIFDEWLPNWDYDPINNYVCYKMKYWTLLVNSNGKVITRIFTPGNEGIILQPLNHEIWIQYSPNYLPFNYNHVVIAYRYNGSILGKRFETKGPSISMPMNNLDNHQLSLITKLAIVAVPHGWLDGN